MKEKSLTLNEVANYLSVSPRTIRRLIQNKQLRGFKVGKNWRFEKQDVLAYIEKQKDK